MEKTAEVLIRVNHKEATDRLQELQKQSEVLKNKIREATDAATVKQLNRELAGVNREIRNASTTVRNMDAALRQLDVSTPKQLRQTIKIINDELNSGRILRGSKEWDAYVAKLRAAKAELASLNRQMSVTSSNNVSFMSRFAGTFTKWWGTYTIMTDAIGGVNMKLSQLKKNFRDKEDSKANLKSLTGLDDESVSWLTEQAERLSTTMDDTGLRIRQSSKEIIDAYMLVGSNKPELLSDKEALNDVTVEAMRLASAAKMDLKPAVDAMTTSLNQYGEGAEAAAKYVNVLAAGSKFGAANVEQQSASILKAGTAAASANVKFEELVGSIEMLGEKGIKGEIAGTGLKKFFLVLQTGAAQTNPKVVGLSTALDNLKKMVDDAEKKSVGGGSGLLKKMFGEEAYSIASILSANTEKVKEYTEAVTDTSIAVEQAAINSDTSAAKIAQLGNKIKEAGNELIERLNPSLGILANWSSRLIETLPGLIDFVVKYRVALTALVSAYVVYNAYLNASIIKDKLKWFWIDKVCGSLKRLKVAMLTHPWGFAAVAVSTLIGLFIDLSRKTEEAAKQQRRLADEQREYKNSLVDISKASADYSKEELARLKKLYSQAMNTTLSQKERNKAVKEMQKRYPDYLGKLSAEEILVGKAQTAYDNLRTSIIEAAKARAAHDKIVENQGAIIDIEMNIDGLKERRKELEKELSEAEERVGAHQIKLNAMSANSYGVNLDIQNRTMQNLKRQKNAILIDMYAVDKQLSDLKKKSEDLAAASDQLDKRYIKPVSPTDSEPESPEGDGGAGKEVDKADEAMKKLKADLEALKKEQHKAEITNTASYASGLIDYAQFCSEKARIESESLDKQIEMHEQHNKIDLSGYLQLLAEKARRKKKAEDDSAKKSLDTLKGEIEARHNAMVDSAYADYTDPDGALFDNKKKLDSRLFQEDIRYLEDQKQLYEGKAEELAGIQRQIDSRLLEDRMEKQRETAEAMAEFEKRYRKAEGSERMAMEKAVLDGLKEKGLVSEEEYNKAIHDIRKKYRDEDLSRARAVRSEYADMILNLKTSWSDLFDELGEKSGSFWEELSNAASATFAVIGAVMSQYSAYADAERDLEVAKIERRYDREIAAAGKNSKKSQQLEKKKEAEIAKVKSKANDRAMKIELAQAFANTALAAINAYASASKVNFLLGPIAAAMATAAGMLQIATIKKQHEAQAMGYYSGGFTASDNDNRREVGVVHANEFVANHKAVANPALLPVLRLIDDAQRSNTVGRLTADDVSNAIGRGQGVVPGGGETASSPSELEAVHQALAMIAGVTATTRQSLDRLSDNLEDGVEARVVMDGEDGFHKKYERYKRLIDNPKR